MESKKKKEAMRAKQIAFERMEMKDFTSARKFSMKAQQLCSDLDNIEQMIMVCNVHSFSGDCYKILDVDPTADMASIRRQYNRMALSLHPDKNKSPGAAEAFRLVLEAKAVLTDVEKRSLYDGRCRAEALGSCKKDDVVVDAVKKCSWGFTAKEGVAKGKRAAKSAPKCGKRVKGNSCSVIGPNSKILEYTDAEYNDFEKLERSKKIFAAGQIWAVYDTLDAMPRFYALINNVVFDDFRVEITWLEPVPDNEDEKKWLYQGLPSSFGKFRLGHSETIEDLAIFSHLIEGWKKSGDLRSVVYEIYPKKGETWAIFKNWNFDWFKDPERHNVFEFEVVEILSDYYAEFGVSVSILGKLNGYGCGFGRLKGKGVDWEVIHAKNRFRFSHKIPSYAVTRIEGSNCVNNFFELDPASMPSNFSQDMI